MDNKEDILDALNEFEKKPSPEIPQVLEQYLQHVAKTGKTLFPWLKLKKLFVTKVDTVMTKFMESSPTDLNIESVKCEELRERVLTLMDEFQGAPFTVQRICELILEPRRHYKRCDKFLRGMEKTMSVVTTVDPFGRKIISESQAMVNGLDSNGFSEGLSKPNPFSTFPTPTQSAWTANIDKWFGSSDQTKTASYDSTALSGEEDEEDVEEDENLTEQLLTENDEEYGVGTSVDEQKPSTSGIANQNKTDNSEPISNDQEQNDSPISSSTPFINDTQSETADSAHQKNVSDSASDTCTSEISENEVHKINTQSDQVLAICEKAQNILESVNKACSEAEETVCIAKKVIETDQQVISKETTSEEQDSDQNVSQTSELPQVQSDIDQTQEQSNEETDSESKNDVIQTDKSESAPSEEINVCSQELPTSDGSVDAGVSDAKKPRLLENCESMDVDSSVLSDSLNNAGSEHQTDSITENEKEEQLRLEGIAEVKGLDEDTPMEQD